MSSPIAPIAAVSPVSSVATAAPTSAATSSSGADFATELSRGLDAVSGAQNNADGLAVQAATGQLVDPAQYTIAATQAALMTQMASTIENKAVTAFNTIMGLQA